MKETILITGVAGLLGSNLADYIIENYGEKYDIVGIDDLSGGYEENINKKVIFYNINLTSNINHIFDTHNPKYVYHLAAYAAEGLSPFIRMYNYNNNLISTANIVNNCIKYKVKRLIFTSSMAVYGNKNKLPFIESDEPMPIDPYGIAKYACEMDIKIAGEQHDLDWCILRPHNVYGIKQNIWDKYRNVLGIWMYKHLNNKQLTIFGDGEQQRAFSYIKDIVEPMYNAAIFDTASREIINLGGTKEYTINEAADILIEVMGGGSKIHLEPRHEAKKAYCTYKKSIDILHYKETYSLKEGLQEMWKWARNTNMKPQKNIKYEITDKIYSYWK